jgi:hypothetical protein
MCIAVLFSAGAAFAQVGANIGGTVQDPSGAAVPAATITILNTSNNVSQVTTTDSEGRYRAVNLQPAPYLITVVANGFSTVEKSVTLLVGTDLQVNFAPSVGSLTQNVQVTATGENTIEVTQAVPSSVVNDTQIAQLPVLNRNFMALAVTMPGAAGTQNLGISQQFILAKFGGVADQRNGYTTILDGAPIDDAIWGSPVINESQDAVQEFKVYRDQYGAQYGGAMNAVVNVVSKSGTENYHGTGYYFGRDQALNAINYFAKSKPPYRLLRSGATVGGRIPKTGVSHFFAAYENLNISTAFIEALPPSNPFAAQENGNYPYTQTENMFDTKLDHRFGEKHSFWTRYAYDNQFIPTGGPANSASSQVNYSPSHSLVAEDDWTISPSLVNILGGDLLIQDLHSLPTNNDLTVSYPDFTFGRNTVDPQYFPRMNETLYDSFYINKAKHNIELGGSVERAFSQYGANYYSVGEFVFTSDTPFDQANSATWPKEFIQETAGNFHNPNVLFAGFVQDDYSVTKRLYFNLGLRYDFTTNLRDNGFYNAILNNPALNGIQNFVSSNRGNEWSDWQPRLGLTYDLRGDGKIVLKAGYGRYVTRNRAWFQEQAEQQTIGAAVFITNPAQLQYYPNITQVLNGETLAQYVANGGPRSAALIDNRFRLPLSNNFTAGFAWQINPNSILEANMVYDRSQNEIGTIDENQPNGPITTTNPRPVPQYTEVQDMINRGWASFKAVEVQLRTRTKGFDNITAAYTYSSSMFDAVTFYSTFYYLNSYAHNPTDTPQNLSVSFDTVYLPGKFKLSGIFTGVSGGPLAVAAGIDLRGTTEPTSGQLPTGLEQTVGLGDKAQQLQIINAYRANPCSYAAAGVKCTATPQAPIPASALNLFPVLTMNLRLTKAFQFKKGKQLELFFEGYNVFNHVTEYGGTTSLVSPSALIHTTALDPRQLQWGTRFTF